MKNLGQVAGRNWCFIFLFFFVEGEVTLIYEKEAL